MYNLFRPRAVEISSKVHMQTINGFETILILGSCSWFQTHSSHVRTVSNLFLPYKSVLTWCKLHISSRPLARLDVLQQPRRGESVPRPSGAALRRRTASSRTWPSSRSIWAPRVLATGFTCCSRLQSGDACGWMP